MVGDFQLAARSLLHMRGSAASAVAALALGIAVTTTMLGVADAALFRPLPFADVDRLVLIYSTRLTPRDGLQQLRWSRPRFVQLQQLTRSLDAVASFTSASLSISLGREGSEDVDPEQVEAEVVSPDYFRALGVTPAAGRVFSGDEDVQKGGPFVTVVSDKLARRRFPNQDALGQIIRINAVPMTIVGVLPPGFDGIGGKAVVWITPAMAASVSYADYLTTPQHFMTVVAHLRPGAALRQVNAELAAIGPRMADDGSPATTTWSAVAIPIGEARVDAQHRRAVIALMAASICVLVIVCVNVAGILLARARTRQRETAIRLALGSGRGRLIRLWLAEGVLLAGAAGTIGTVLAAWTMDVYARSAPAVLPTAANNYSAVSTFGMPALDARVLALALVTTIGTTLIFAVVPALQAARTNIAAVLRAGDRGGTRRTLAQSVLVATQVALAVMLLAGAGLLIESYMRWQDRRTGYDPDRVLTFWVRPPTSRYVYPDGGPGFIERLLASVEGVAGVQSAAVNRCVPFSGCSRTTAFFPDRPDDPASAPVVGRHYISPGYFATLGIPLMAGRSITDADRESTAPVAVVNHTGAARFWPGRNPIGQHVWFGPTTGPFADPARPVEIVGVVGDVKYEGAQSRDDPSRADFYTSYRQFWYPDTMVIVKASGPLTALEPLLGRAVASVDPTLPIFDVMTLDERVDAALARPRFTMTLLAGFAAMALVLAALGVYSVLSYSVTSRVRELGIRIALGADRRRVILLVVGDGLRVTAAGAAVGVVAAIAAGQFVQGLAADMAGIDARLLAGVVIVIGVAALAAALVPARLAASVDPIVSLRQE